MHLLHPTYIIWNLTDNEVSQDRETCKMRLVDVHRRTEDALVSAHEIEPNNPDVAAALKQLKKNMEDYKWRTRNLTKFSLKFSKCRKMVPHIFGIWDEMADPNIHVIKNANYCIQCCNIVQVKASF